MGDPLPFREHVQRYVGMHRIVWEELVSAYPEADPGKLLEQTNAVLATIVIQADRSHAQIDYGELDGMKQYKPVEAPTTPSNGGRQAAPMKMNPYAIVVKRLEERRLSKKQYAVLVELVVASRRMTREQHQKMRPSDLKRWVMDLAEEDLTNYVIAEGVV